MKTLRIIATILLGAYLVAMGAQFVSMSIDLVRKGISPYSEEAPAAFFTNLLVCTLSAMAIWALWRKRRKTSDSSPDSSLKVT